MISRSLALTRACLSAEGTWSTPRRCRRSKSTTAASAAQSFRAASPKDKLSKEDWKEHYASISRMAQEKVSQEKDFFISVLESSSSATKRDAKVYLQTFGPTIPRMPPRMPPGPKSPAAAVSTRPVDAVRLVVPTTSAQAISNSPLFIQGAAQAAPTPDEAMPHVAVIKLALPQCVDDAMLAGVAKTLAQLRALGLISITVLDCQLDPSVKDWPYRLGHQINRLAGAIDEYGEPFTTVLDNVLAPDSGPLRGSFLSSTVIIKEVDTMLAPLLRGAAVLVPSFTLDQDSRAHLVDSDDVVFAITRCLSGLQMAHTSPAPDVLAGDVTAPTRKAFVDRVIILDALGGIPAKNRWDNAHVFLNLEDEFESARAHLKSADLRFRLPQARNPSESVAADAELSRQQHTKNLELSKRTLSILPPTSSALITTPAEAANMGPRADQGEDGSIMGFVGTVGTRRSHNPLIHNLLTDRPSFSPSLPLGRIRPISRTSDPSACPVMSPTTLVKRGMPVTVFPDPNHEPWRPPRPGSPRLRLTDTCIDLPRLVHLIQDSFGRKLDVQHYLKRVDESLAGIIVAGEYEGGAIMTWERPSAVDEQTAYESGRLVPYLDKFAVLRRSQGAGGVADIVFNAMARDCFPDGVCWRSRKNNPVNKWYFERSRGTWKLGGTEWAMFWTTPDVTMKSEKIRDYEDVCRNIEPSWADKQHITS